MPAAAHSGAVQHGLVPAAMGPQEGRAMDQIAGPLALWHGISSCQSGLPSYWPLVSDSLRPLAGSSLLVRRPRAGATRRTRQRLGLRWHL